MDIEIGPGSIVVAVDGSEHADFAVRWAAEQAGLEHRTLTVVTAVATDELVVRWADIGGLPPRTTAALRERGRSLVQAAAREARDHRPGITVDTRVVLSDPRFALERLSHAAHLLALGSRGRGPLRRMLLGTVSAHVARWSRCPVVVCRPPSGPSGEWGVAVGADGTAESRPVVEFAFRQAALRGLPLTVVHCAREPLPVVAGYRHAGGGPVPAFDEVEELRVVLAQSVAGLSEKYPEVNVSQRLSQGMVEVALGPHSWDLVVVGRHSRDPWRRFLTGSVSASVLERSHSTVAVVPQEGDPET